MSFATSWAPITTSEQINWQPIRCSADGTKIVACPGSFGSYAVGSPRVSLDSGVTWSANGPTDYEYNGLFCTPDFSKIIAPAGSDPFLVISADGGVTWDTISSNDIYGYDHRIAGDITGANLYLSTGLGGYLKSTNGGIGFSDISLPGSSYHLEFACSATGQIVYHANSYSGIYKSTDYGETWTLVYADTAWSYIDCSDDGSVIVIGGGNKWLGVSTDSGATWNYTSIEDTPLDGQEFAVACNSTGQYMIGGGQTGKIFTSDDYGTTWTPVVMSSVAKPVLGFAISNDGSVAYASVDHDHIYKTTPFAITSITPNNGPSVGGTPVTITGVGFDPAATASIGGSNLSELVVVNATTITGKTPPGTVGARDVVVTNP